MLLFPPPLTLTCIQSVARRLSRGIVFVGVNFCAEFCELFAGNGFGEQAHLQSENYCTVELMLAWPETTSYHFSL